MSNIPALAIQQANDAVPGTVPRIPGANKVLVSDSTGSASAWADPAGLIGAGTLPAPALIATSNITLSGLVTVDGTASNSVTGDVLCVSQTAPDQNGYWTPSGSGAWGRPSYFNSNAQVTAQLGLSSGNATSGVRNIGSQWYLKSGTTLAAAKSYAKVTTQDLKVIDLSQAPYFVQTDVPVDQAPKIRQFLYDYAGTNPGDGAIGVLPSAKSYIYVGSPIVALTLDNITIRGAGRQSRLLANAFMQGGHMIVASKQSPPIVYGGLGTPTKVDSSWDQPLVMYNVGSSGDDHPFFNLTHAGFTWGGRATCHVTLRYRWLDLSLQGYVISTRGREMFGDSLDECFRIQANANGSVTAKLRIGGTVKTCTRPAGTVVTGTNYCVDLTYDGANMKLYVSAAGAAKDTPTLGDGGVVAATGSITDFAWEETHLGKQQNEDFPESSTGASCANGVFGSFQVTTGINAIPPTTGTTTTGASLSAALDFLGPVCHTSVNDAVMSPSAKSDGSSPITSTALAYACFFGDGHRAWLPVRRGASNFTTRFGVQNLMLDCGQGSGILFSTVKNGLIDDVQIASCQDGVYLTSTSYYTTIRDVDISCTRVGLSVQNTGYVTLSGRIVIVNGWYQYVENTSGVTQFGNFAFESGGTVQRAALLVKFCQGSRFQKIAVDDEGTGVSYARGVIVASVADGAQLTIEGDMSLQNPSTTFVFGSDGNLHRGTWFNGMRHQTAAGAAYVVNVLDTNVTPMVRTLPYKLIGAGPATYTNQPSCVRDYNAPTLPGAALTNVDSTILYSAGDTRPIPTVVATANRATTLSATGVLLGQRWAFPVSAAQGFTWAFINGGGGGGTLFTAATTYVGTPEFIFDGTNWKLYRC